jgi:geranylgeranyl pyrophosphate synthase
LAEGVYTLPILHALQSDAADTVRQWFTVQPSQAEAIQTLKSVGAFDKAFEEIAIYNQQALTALSETGQQNSGLTKLPEAYLAWAKRKMVML